MPSTAPEIAGSPEVGATLTASTGEWQPRPGAFQYRWQVREASTTRVRVKMRGKVRLIRRTVITWRAVADGGSQALTPPSAALGKRLRACVRAQARQGPRRSAWSAWRCSRSTAPLAAAVARAPGPDPAPLPTPAPEAAPLSISFGATTFFRGQGAQQITPTVSGGTGTKSFSFAGTLPPGVDFDAATGTFTGPQASAWNFQATQIALGNLHSCALTTVGGVKCWGFGGQGRLGNGSTLNRDVPVDVRTSSSNPAPLRGVTQISPGGLHTCAVMTSGGVKCWGAGSNGQLGTGGIANALAPVDVRASAEDADPLGNIAQVSAGFYQACAVTTSGRVKCWGEGANGRLGNGGTDDALAPMDVVGTGGSGTLSGIAQVFTAFEHTCAVTTSGGVKCWGEGDFGQLGNGAMPATQSTPVDVVGTDGTGTLSGIAQVTAGGSHTCALTTQGGGVKCWGQGWVGQLGNGATPASQAVPVDVTGLTAATHVEAGQFHTCAATEGGVRCWGFGTAGQLGNNATPSIQSTPVNVVRAGGEPTLSGALGISAGIAHTCALTAAGGVQCWGNGEFGKLGNGASPAAQSTPVETQGSGEQPGFPAELTVTVTDAAGFSALGRLVLEVR